MLDCCHDFFVSLYNITLPSPGLAVASFPVVTVLIAAQGSPCSSSHQRPTSPFLLLCIPRILLGHHCLFGQPSLSWVFPRHGCCCHGWLHHGRGVGLVEFTAYTVGRATLPIKAATCAKVLEEILWHFFLDNKIPSLPNLLLRITD